MNKNRSGTPRYNTRIAALSLSGRSHYRYL